MNNNEFKRITYIILIVVGIILGILAINRLFMSVDSSSVTNQLLLNTSLDEINKVEFILPDKHLIISKDKDKWSVNNLPASSRTVEVALSKLLAVEINYTVTKDASTFGTYNVNETTSMLKVAYADQTKDFYVGKQTFEGGSFIRESNSNSVFGTNTSINSIFDYDVAYFRDKTITKFNYQDVLAVQIDNSSIKNDHGYWSVNTKPIASELINPWLVQLSNIEGIALASVEDASQIQKLKSIRTINLNTTSQNYILEFYSYKNSVYAKLNNTEYVVIIDSLFQEIEDGYSRLI